MESVMLMFPQVQTFLSNFLLHLSLLANSSTMSAANVNCRWEDKTARERELTTSPNTQRPR